MLGGACGPRGGSAAETTSAAIAPGIVGANLLIAGGTLVLGASGVLNSVLDEMRPSP